MKKILLSLLAGLALTVAPVSAQTLVQQGGTGLTSVASSSVLMGSSNASRLVAVSTSTLSTMLNILSQARQAISSSINAITYDNTTGVLSLTSGYNIPLTASTTNWNNFYDTPSSRITAGTNMSWAGNTLNGLSDASIRGLLSSSATGLTYNNSTGVFTLTSGYNIPLTASTTNWNNFYDTPSSRITAGANCLWTGNTINCTSAGGATTTINGVSGPTFTFNASSTGFTDFTISTSTGVVNFHIPSASASNRGLLTSADWTTFNNKAPTASPTFTGTVTLANASTTAVTAPTLYSTTQLWLKGLLSDSVNATGTANSVLSSTGTSTLWIASTGSGSNVLATSPTLVTPNLGTPSAITLTNGTGLPISTGVSGLGTGIATFLATPSSANLKSAVTDETGTGGALVFATSPSLTTPNIGSASSTALGITGALYDSLQNAGTLGMVLQATGTSTKWVATSTLGIASSLSGGTTGKVTTWSSPTTLSSGILLDDGTVAGVNATSSTVTFYIKGNAGSGNALTVASSSGSAIFTVKNNGDATINGLTAGLGTNQIANNTAFGASALAGNNSGGGNNSAFGSGALQANTSGTNNTALGYQSLFAIQTGLNNTAVGKAAGLNIAGSRNTIVGYNALSSNTSGGTNTSIGTQANNANVSGSGNVALGYLAGAYELGSDTFYVNNRDWTASTTERASSLLYGTFNSTAANQTLNINASTTAFSLTSTGFLTVAGQTTLGNASSTAHTATTLYSTTATIGTNNITKANITNASTTNMTLSGAFHDSVGSLGSSGQVLQSTGTSTQWATASGGGSFLAATTTNSSISSSAAETTLGTISIPAGTFSTNRGIKFRIVMSNSRSGYGGAETHRIKFGGTTLYTMTDDPAGTPSEGPTFIYEGMILAAGATNSQEASIYYTQSGASSVGVAGTGQGTSAIDTTSAQNLTITGQCADATPVCTVTLLSYLIEKIQ